MSKNERRVEDEGLKLDEECLHKGARGENKSLCKHDELVGIVTCLK
jgi:hypothetical protein